MNSILNNVNMSLVNYGSSSGESSSECEDVDAESSNLKTQRHPEGLKGLLSVRPSDKSRPVRIGLPQVSHEVHMYCSQCMYLCMYVCMYLMILNSGLR